MMMTIGSVSRQCIFYTKQSFIFGRGITAMCPFLPLTPEQSLYWLIKPNDYFRVDQLKAKKARPEPVLSFAERVIPTTALLCQLTTLIILEAFQIASY
jgi:hypothetical protein